MNATETVTSNALAGMRPTSTSGSPARYRSASAGPAFVAMAELEWGSTLKARGDEERARALLARALPAATVGGWVLVERRAREVIQYGT
jgi:hypothetical protein